MIFNLKFIVDGSIDAFLEKNLFSGPGPESENFFLLKIKKKGNSILDPGPESKNFFWFKIEKKEIRKNFLGGPDCQIICQLNRG